MSSFEGDSQNLGLFTRETASDVSIGDRVDPQHGYNYDPANGASYLVLPSRPTESAATAFEPNLIRPSTSYILMRSDNLESNVDCWIESCDNERNRRREINLPCVQQPSLAGVQGVLASLWYMLALLPAISVNGRGWCSPSNSFAAVLNGVDVVSKYLKQIILHVRTKLTRLEIDQILHECFVVALDVALAFHAIIFLVLAVYQDSI